MQNFTNKIDFGSTFQGNEANDLFTELKNAVTSSGQTLDPNSISQLVQSVVRHSMAGDFMSCSGSGSNYLLSSSGSFAGVTAYAVGQVFRFIPSFVNSGAATVDVLGLGARPLVKADGSAFLAGEISTGRQVTIVYDGASFKLIHVAFDTVPAASSSAVADLRPGGRLTLTSGTPVLSTPVSGATTLYYTPHVTAHVPLYSGGVFSPTYFTEKSISVPATTDTMYDVFGYLSSGTLALELLAWTNDTTRATALSRTAGLLTKSGDPTRLYLGSIRTGSVSGQTLWTSSQSFIWNQYNRAATSLTATNTTASWTETASPAALQGNTTIGVGRLAYILGNVVEGYFAETFGDHMIRYSNTPGSTRPANLQPVDITGDTVAISQGFTVGTFHHPYIAVGVNSTSTPAPGSIVSGRHCVQQMPYIEAGWDSARRTNMTSWFLTSHSLGYNYIQAIGFGQYSNFYGNAGMSVDIKY